MALAALVAVLLLISIIMLQASSYRKAELRRITVHRRTHADSEQPTEEVQNIEKEVELQDLPTSAEVQTDTEPTESHTTFKPVNPAVELTLIRRTSVDKVRLVGGIRSCLGLYIYIFHELDPILIVKAVLLAITTSAVSL